MRNLLLGTIPMAKEYRSEVKDHVDKTLPSCLHYRTVENREKFRSKIEKGKIARQNLLTVTDESGHYQPELTTTYRFLKFLRREGVALDEVSVKLFTLKYQINAQEFLKEVESRLEQGKTLEKAVKQAARAAVPFTPYRPGSQTSRIAVLAPDCKLYSGIDRLELPTHSVITSGGPVRWAGELVTANPNQADTGAPSNEDMLKAIGVL